MFKEFITITFFLLLLNREALQEIFEIISHPNHVMVRGYEFLKNDVFLTDNVITRCKCHFLCMENECCQSFSTKPRDTFGFLCSLSEKLPADCNLVNGSDDSYVSVPFAEFEKYWWPDQQTGFYAAQRICRTKPGYRLGIYKAFTEVQELREFEVLRKRDCIHVDMLEIANDGIYGLYQWNDGTFIKDTEIFSQMSLLFHADERHIERTFMSWSGSRFEDNVHYRVCDVLCIFDPALFFGNI